MKKTIFAAIALLAFAASPAEMLAQAKKPTLMVLPADVWCVNNGYTTEYSAQGKTTRVADYARAYQENADLVDVTTKIGELMAERGFPMVNANSMIRDINRSDLENEMTTSRGGSAIAETPLERLQQRAKADITVELTWKVNTQGPRSQVTYTLSGIDSYSNKQVAAAQGTGEWSSSASVPKLLEDATVQKMDNFLDQLMAHFEDMAANGREVVVNVMLFDNGGDLTFESEYNGEELTDIIDDWMAQNTVNHRYSLRDAGETRLSFDQVRIPLYRENNMPMDTRHFARNLTKMLAKPPYNLPAKLLTKGLGRIDIVLGEK